MRKKLKSMSGALRDKRKAAQTDLSMAKKRHNEPTLKARVSRASTRGDYKTSHTQSMMIPDTKSSGESKQHPEKLFSKIDSIQE